MKTNLHNKFYCIQSKQFFFDPPRIEKKSPSKFHRTNHPSEV